MRLVTGMRALPVTALAAAPVVAHASIPKHEGEEGTVKYVLGVAAAGDGVSFSVNGDRVATLPRALVAPDGACGLRVDHMLNLHVTSLGVAPPRADAP